MKAFEVIAGPGNVFVSQRFVDFSKGEHKKPRFLDVKKLFFGAGRIRPSADMLITVLEIHIVGETEPKLGVKDENPPRVE